jgi:hypothetical protein
VLRVLALLVFATLALQVFATLALQVFATLALRESPALVQKYLSQHLRSAITKPPQSCA